MIVRVETEPSVTEILNGCQEMQLTTYDFTYFDVARRLGMLLLTGDAQLRRAAEKAGVELLLP